MRRFYEIMGLLAQTATQGAPAGAAGAAGATDINSSEVRNEPAMDWPEGDLPEQMGGSRTTMLPGTDTFRIPENVAQLWHDIVAEDKRPYLPNGQPNTTKGQKVKRRQLKFDKNSPLVVVGGKYDGEPMTASFSTAPRPRGKADDPKTAWISDAAYLLDMGLADKSRPTDSKVLEATINRYAGRTVRLEHGLSAQCRPDKVRYIAVELPNEQFNPNVPDSPANPRTVTQTMQDPQGTKGCGERYYTRDFKNPEAKDGESPWDLTIVCDCGAVLRGFESVDRILAPLGQQTQTQTQK